MVCGGKWTAAAQSLILTGVVHLLADTLCVLRINYRPKIGLRLRGITEPIGLRDMEITPTMGK